MHLSSHYMRNADIQILEARLPEAIRSRTLAEVLRERSRTFVEFDHYANMVESAPMVSFTDDADIAILE